MAALVRGALSVAFALSLISTALADKIATLHARGTAPLAERTSMRTATELAAKGLGHVTIAEQDVLQGESAAGDTAATSAGLVTVGKTTGSDWVVVPILTAGPKGTRLEIQACQVSTGRVESLDRDLDPKVDPTLQAREMLALLLRPQGVADDPLPWDQAAKKPAPSASVSGAVSSSGAPPIPKSPPPHYGEGKIAIGLGGGVMDIVSRPKEVQQSKRFGFGWNAALLIAIPTLSWAEVIARLSGVHGPGNAIAGDVGARATARVSRFALGGELTLGAFGQLGGAQAAQFTTTISPVVAIAITRTLAVDVRPISLRVATGAGTVVIASADVALFLRF